VFLVKHIHKLGSQAVDFLHQHYSIYGEVARVIDAPLRTKTTNGRAQFLTGGLGIVVMKSSEAVLRILAPGEEQRIAGHLMTVRPFTVLQAAKDGGEISCKLGARGSASKAKAEAGKDAETAGQEHIGSTTAGSNSRGTGSGSGSNSRESRSNEDQSQGSSGRANSQESGGAVGSISDAENASVGSGSWP
jgi:hypothetical protein